MPPDAQWDQAADVYFRRIRPADVEYDHILGRERPQSGCFTDDSDGTAMSAFSLHLLEQHGLRPEEVLIGYESFRLVAIPGELLRELHLEVAAVEGDDDLPDGEGGRRPHPSNPAHVEIRGPKSKTVRKALKKLEFYETA